MKTKLLLIRYPVSDCGASGSVLHFASWSVLRFFRGCFRAKKMRTDPAPPAPDPAAAFPPSLIHYLILGITLTFSLFSRGQVAGQVAPVTVPPPDQPSIAPPAVSQQSQAADQYRVAVANAAYANGVAGGGGSGGGGFAYWAGTYLDADSPVSVISFKQSDEKVMDETAEDLNILSLILSQHLERAGAESSDYKLGIPIVLKTSGHAVTASYIEGFGAIFSLKVRFPLVAPQIPGGENQNTAAQSQWDEARRALRGDAEPVSRSWQRTREVEPYDPRMVETLKKRALELLRNASNLRHVKDDEWVIVNFFGPPSALGVAREAGHHRTSVTGLPANKSAAPVLRGKSLDNEAYLTPRHPASGSLSSSRADSAPEAPAKTEEPNAGSESDLQPQA